MRKWLCGCFLAGHPDGHGIGWEQLPLSPRRGWWGPVLALRQPLLPCSPWQVVAEPQNHSGLSTHMSLSVHCCRCPAHGAPLCPLVLIRKGGQSPAVTFPPSGWPWAHRSGCMGLRRVQVGPRVPALHLHRTWRPVSWWSGSQMWASPPSSTRSGDSTSRKVLPAMQGAGGSFPGEQPLVCFPRTEAVASQRRAVPLTKGTQAATCCVVTWSDVIRYIFYTYSALS